MNITLNRATIVVLASNHNPSIATKDWLSQKKIIEEKPTNFTNTPLFSLFESQSLILTVDPERLEIGAKAFGEANIDQVKSVMLNYVSALPETRYTSVGLNYIWIARPDENEDALNFLKNTFLPRVEKVSSVFGNIDIFVGSVIYSPFEQFLARIVIEPVLVRKEETFTGKQINCNFNYHAQVKKLDELVSAVSKFRSAKEHSQKITSDLLCR